MDIIDYKDADGDNVTEEVCWSRKEENGITFQRKDTSKRLIFIPFHLITRYDTEKRKVRKHK